MRQSTRSSSSSLNSNTRGRCIKVILLNREELTVFVEGKAKVQDVFNQVCEHLNLRETEFFGLAKFIEDEFQFIEGTTKLDKLIPKKPKSWRPQKPEDRPGLTLYFRVQYYVEHVSLLKERATRQLYYQQLKDNLLHYSQEVSEEKCFLLAAYSLQSDIGNYVAERHHHTEYFDPREYFPAWVVDKHSAEYIHTNMPIMHQDCHNMPRQQAAMLYIRELSRPPTQHNMHMYHLRKQKQESRSTVWVAVCPQGLHIYQDEGKFRTLLSTFLWGDIGRLHFEKKKFEIQPSGSGEPRKFRYYTGSEERGKYLLALCQMSHQFQMGMAPKLAEQKKYEEEDKRYRESYIYSMETPGGSRGSGILMSKLSLSARSTGRTSTTSSQTTSGIASEKLHLSYEENEDTEILIDSPPQVVPSLQQQLSPSTSVKTHNSSLGLGSGHINLATISRNSSAHSHHSGAALVAAFPLKPADTHIQKMTFAQTMTVSSHSVVPRAMGAAPAPEMMNGPVSSQQQQQQQQQGFAFQNPQALPRPQFLQTYSSTPMQLKRQYAEPLVPRTSGTSNTSEHLPRTPTDPLPPTPNDLLQRSPVDHTYANTMDTLSPVMYTQASPTQGTGPLTSTPYQSPQDHTVYLPSANEFIVNRPGRSHSQVTSPQVKVLSPPQRAVSNAEAYITKRPTRVDCPIHGIHPELFKEIQAKSHRRKDLPLLQALCQDRMFLHQDQCTCNVRGGDRIEGAQGVRRYSYSSASTPDLYNHPGTVVRPVSWHEPQHIDPNTLQVIASSINIDEQQQQQLLQQQQQQQHHHSQHQHSSSGGSNPHYSSHLSDSPHHQPQFLSASPPMQTLSYSTGAFHQSMDSLDYPTMFTYQFPQNQPQLISGSLLGTQDVSSRTPLRLYSGGLSGAQSVDNLLQTHNYTMGIATS